MPVPAASICCSPVIDKNIVSGGKLSDFVALCPVDAFSDVSDGDGQHFYPFIFLPSFLLSSISSFHCIFFSLPSFFSSSSTNLTVFCSYHYPSVSSPLPSLSSFLTFPTILPYTLLSHPFLSAVLFLRDAFQSYVCINVRVRVCVCVCVSVQYCIQTS